MSLINDALKKAQRQRADDSASALAPMPGGGRGPSKMGKSTLVLIGAGLVLLVVLAVVFTVMYVTPKTPEPVASVPKPATAAALAPKPPQVIVAAPVDKAPIVAVEAAKVAAPTPVPTEAVPVINVAPLVAATPDEQVQALIDKMRVTGVRTSASGSKVLMNDHIVRLNDLVDRDSGLRLIKIEDGTLTFKDKQGAIYTKSY